MKYTEEQLYENLYSGAEGHLQLPYEDACVIQQTLLSHGYAVLMTSGDIRDYYKIEWIYAGDVDNLTYADSGKVVFASTDYLDMLRWGEYIEPTEDK